MIPEDHILHYQDQILALYVARQRKIAKGLDTKLLDLQLNDLCAAMKKAQGG